MIQELSGVKNNGLKPSWMIKKLDEESYRSFLKSYGHDWDMRFGVYYEDGWHYVYRSNFLKNLNFKNRMMAFIM